ncbi:hypothetical protein LN042_24145 [Kitasatospora sp. RB6PN24]|uniref:hypothetical protein n=1 Tax=Kitasatospora humi TaxID=2893891 RepID=UPI001E6197D2|nr:hypothetical protein [Kitasatospora humi]MCC9310121.1 hypothetical protein [Kitasatospora humi]
MQFQFSSVVLASFLIAAALGLLPVYVLVRRTGNGADVYEPDDDRLSPAEEADLEWEEPNLSVYRDNEPEPYAGSVASDHLPDELWEPRLAEARRRLAVAQQLASARLNHLTQHHTDPGTHRTRKEKAA